MITKKLYIKHLGDEEFVKEKQKNYSYAFRRLYKMIEESSDKEFVSRFKETFSLNDIEFRSLLTDVKSFKEREIKEWEIKEARISELSKFLQKNNLTKRERFKAQRRMAYLSRGIGRESVFGGRSLLQRLSRECNRKCRDEEKINQLRAEFRDNRILPFFVIGEANYKGNRFFSIKNLAQGEVVYKPHRGKKISITVNIPRGWEKDLQKLVELSERKEIPFSVMLSTKHLCVIYDEERLNGYAVDEVARRAEVREIKKQRHPKEVESQLIRDTYRAYYDKQRAQKLVGKVPNRCLAVDMNPTEIGFSVLDKAKEGAKVIRCGLIDLSKICQKSSQASYSRKSKYFANKRHYEITIIVKRFFKIAKHYGCSSFVLEELRLSETLSREANRKVKNIWNRMLFINCVRRRCNENGIDLDEVNPCYSSFIGNIQHPYADACNASIEIGRRGLHRYENGGFYPHIAEEDIRTLEAKFGDVVGCSTVGNWAEIYKSLTNSIDKVEFAHRLRTGMDEALTPHTSFSIDSYKSRVKINIFN